MRRTMWRQGETTVKLNLKRILKRRGASDFDDYEEYMPPPPPRRLTRQARETLAFCLAVGMVAVLVWGIYLWTNASRYTPPLYHGTTTLHQ